ncbi:MULTISPECIES: Lrp/AsnC family transcriptional regulator [Candidatus Nitrosocaldus]|jgi:DNA-binding Lrp family transcriptional regulator|uniref:Transcriptional regulator, AsnC family n=1 Tax=Candidatus Nitrosocaldus cavascurensis TaxID=2058097 RepID=A0A2K5AP39_9ARCH|nr:MULTISPECIES: Lrp/AsnC ligand binding domain-containing protein [Candidatus Nitrosocaldus]SPC33400.1 Transcriptional regulator, AsnC family [Candidatus Nitrosocaldus cavascurensis]
MPSAYVLINCDLGSEEEIIREIRAIRGVKEVKGTYGVYDIVVKVDGNSMEELKDTITWKIRRLPKVRSTVTLIVIEGQGE